MVIITLDGKTKSLENGEAYTFACAGKSISSKSNLTVTFDTVGYLEYDGLITVGQNGKTRTFASKGKKMVTDIVITAGEYGGGLPSPHPIEITSENEMDALLAKATDESVGAVYKFRGTSNKYEDGELYIIAKEGV